MKKLFVITVLAALCSYLNSQTISLDFLEDTITYTFNEYRDPIIKSNPDLQPEFFDKGFAYHTQYIASNDTAYPIQVMLFFEEDSTLGGTITWVAHDITEEEYKMLYDELTEIFGEPYEMEVDGFLERHPRSIYILIKDGMAEFYQLHKKDGTIFRIRAEGKYHLQLVSLEIHNYTD